MSKSITFRETYTSHGVDYPRTRTVVADSEVSAEPVGNIAVAHTGSLTTRTNNTDGTITMDPGHGLTTGRIDIYWSGGSRRGVSGTVTVDAVAITGGVGDNLPTQGTAVRVAAPHVEDLVFTGDNAVTALVWATLAAADYPGWVVFTTAANAEVVAYQLTGSIPVWSWDLNTNTVNPFAGQSVTKVYFSHGNTDTARQMGATVLYN